MPTKTVDMAYATPPTRNASSPRVPEVEVVKVSIRNRDKRPAGRELNDVDLRADQIPSQVK